MNKGPISKFISEHYKHFNAATLVDAAKAYESQLESGHKMMITMAGAMSTAELGRSLAEMIRQDKVHIIVCTGANLEEDVFNLVAHDHYKRVPHYRDLSPEDEKELLDGHFNRVTDTCIPEEEAMRRLETHLVDRWVKASQEGKSYFPHEYFFDVLLSGELDQKHQIPPENSWLLAAAEKGIPVIVPGWEDSTCGNFFASHCIEGDVSTSAIKGGIEYMIYLAKWYEENAGDKGIGFFQIGGGIAGDFPICVVPMLHQDLGKENVPMWSYFCQISDSTTSYGSYSGAVPNEKITWGKLEVDTPKFVIESDATIVAPLMFAYVLGW
ncbi:MAG: deoxyhypusine synthase family protein [Salibacteraceae bacterium]